MGNYSISEFDCNWQRGWIKIAWKNAKIWNVCEAKEFHFNFCIEICLFHTTRQALQQSCSHTSQDTHIEVFLVPLMVLWLLKTDHIKIHLIYQLSNLSLQICQKWHIFSRGLDAVGITMSLSSQFITHIS